MSDRSNLQSCERSFVCSCEKSYLSYAALFTHIKQKHGGKAPGPITRPRSQNKRGRPRKVDSSSGDISYPKLRNPQFNLGEGQQFQQIISLARLGSSFSQCLPSNEQHPIAPENRPIASEKDHFGRGFRRYRCQDQQSAVESNITNCKKQTIAPTKPFKNIQQSDLRQNAEGLLNVMSETTKQVTDEYFKQKTSNLTMFKRFKAFDFSQESKRLSASLKCYLVTMGKGISEYLQHINCFLRQSQCREVELLMFVFVQHISSRQENQNCLTNRNVYETTKYLNDFLEEHLGDEVRNRGLEETWVFRENNPIRVLHWFFDWLNIKQYTYFKVQMNPDYLKESEKTDTHENNAVRNEMYIV